MSAEVKVRDGVVVVKVSNRTDVEAARDNLRKELRKKRRRTAKDVSVIKSRPLMTREEIIQNFKDMKEDLNKLAHR